MAENIQRSKGRNSNYKFDRGGSPTEFGPFIGVVKNNVDPIRIGRVQVYIEEFAGLNEDDPSTWRTVSYLSPFYGTTPTEIRKDPGTTKTGEGEYVGNPHSYGMWFTPPDLGVRVLCFFASGDPNQGFYVGCVPEPSLNHMVPAVGSTSKYVAKSPGEKSLLAGAERLPTTELNPHDPAIISDPRFYDKPKPIHKYAAAILQNQGLSKDPVRGSIGSSSQRESPSTVYGMSTPGRPVFQSGILDEVARQQFESNIPQQNARVIARRGGHTFVMDDGDIDGRDQLIRIRTALGHQITFSDDGQTIYIIHGNGLSWVELGQQGTVDIYAANSVNVRTQGDLNFHADRDINFNAGRNFNLRAAKDINTQSESKTTMRSKDVFTVHSESTVGIRADGSLALVGKKKSSINGGGRIDIKAGKIGLNSGGTMEVSEVKPFIKNKLDDVKGNAESGWAATAKIETIVTRAPTHEPYPYHNKGTDAPVNLG